jgi:hypothetical protein
MLLLGLLRLWAAAAVASLGLLAVAAGRQPRSPGGRNTPAGEWPQFTAPPRPRATRVASGDDGELQVVDWPARIFTIDNFLSGQEVDHLIEMGHRALTSQHGDVWRTRHAYSTVIYGAADYDDGRTLRDIEERIDRLTMIGAHKDETPIVFTRQLPGAIPGTDLVNQALRNVHHDRNQRENRVVSVIVYLSTAKARDGGHTLFPCLPRQVVDELPQPESAKQLANGLAATLRSMYENGTRIIKAEEGQYPGRSVLQICSRQCAMATDSQVLSVRPKRGTAVVIWHVRPDGRPNHAAVRASPTNQQHILPSCLRCMHAAPPRIVAACATLTRTEVGWGRSFTEHTPVYVCLHSGTLLVRLPMVTNVSPFKSSRRPHEYLGSGC